MLPVVESVFMWHRAVIEATQHRSIDEAQRIHHVFGCVFVHSSVTLNSADTAEGGVRDIVFSVSLLGFFLNERKERKAVIGGSEVVFPGFYSSLMHHFQVP